MQIYSSVLQSGVVKHLLTDFYAHSQIDKIRNQTECKSQLTVALLNSYHL